MHIENRRKLLKLLAQFQEQVAQRQKNIWNYYNFGRPESQDFKRISDRFSILIKILKLGPDAYGNKEKDIPFPAGRHH